MTLAKRRFYFFLFFLLFLIASPVIILYSQGYALNLTTFSLVKTGGVFVSTTPKGVIIRINDKLAATTSSLPLTQGKLIARLLPGDYAVTIEKSGYFPWDKS